MTFCGVGQRGMMLLQIAMKLQLHSMDSLIEKRARLLRLSDFIRIFQRLKRDRILQLLLLVIYGMVPWTRNKTSGQVAEVGIPVSRPNTDKGGGYL